MKIFEQIEHRRPWNEAEQLLLDQVRRVANDVIRSNAAEVDRTGSFPWRNVEVLNQLCLNAIFIPEEYGGAELPFGVYLAAVKLIAEACASTGIIFATNFHAIKPVIAFGSEAQKQRFLPIMVAGGLAALAITEQNAGSDATGMETRFTPDGDSLIVDGHKQFITSGDVADLILLFGKYAGIDDPRKAISVIVLEKGTPGLEVLRLEDKMGHRGSSTASLRFNGCRVPRSNMIGQPGDGLPILLESLNRSRPSIAAHALGIAYAAFGDMVEYMNTRRQSGRRIIDFQGNQFLIADLAADLALADNWLAHLTELIESGAEEFGLAASIAKLRASDAAMRITTEAVQMFGGYGYCTDFRVERLMRDAKITQIWEGTNQVHRQLIGRSFAAK